MQKRVHGKSAMHACNPIVEIRLDHTSHVSELSLYFMLTGTILHWLSTVKITRVYADEDGNVNPNIWTGRSLKLYFDLEGNHKAIFKIKRY